MAPKRRLRRKTWQTESPSAQGIEHSKPASSTPEAAQEAPLGDLSHPQALSSNQMLHLQRVMGNQGVMRLLDRQGPAQITRNAAGATIQRLISYQEFLKSARKMAKVGPEIFGPASGMEALDQAMAAQNMQTIPSWKVVASDADFLAAYQQYENDNSLANLIHLFDTITYWEALNNANRDKKWYEPVMLVVSGLKEQIRAEVQAKTKEMYAKPEELDQEMDNLAEATRIRNKHDQHYSLLMPQFMRDVGVAPRYFHKHLQTYPERIDALRVFNDALRDGNLALAATTYRTTLQAVPGMYLIKPLFIHKYSANAGLGGLLGTNPDANPNELTHEELQAIRAYSMGDYTAMNEDLRNAVSQDANDARRNQSALAVSGMNKLPPFKGIAYRGLVTEPGGYFDVIQPGAAIVDLAFQSASPSLTGVRNYLDSKDYGSHHIYFMVRTSKSAVNIMDKAAIPKEGEILFKPGVRFVVKAVWHHVGGLVPPNAPPEAQMILHAQSQYKNDIQTGQLHQVKVIEMVEQ